MDDLTIRVATAGISGEHPTKPITISEYYAKIKIQNDIDLLPMILYHFYYYREGGKVTTKRHKFINPMPKLTVGTPEPRELFKTILPILSNHVIRWHYRACELGEMLANTICKKFHYTIKKCDYAQDYAIYHLVPR